MPVARILVIHKSAVASGTFVSNVRVIEYRDGEISALSRVKASVMTQGSGCQPASDLTAGHQAPAVRSGAG
jgi:hypothetical protein